MDTGDSVEPGSIHNWARRIARKHRRLEDAVKELRVGMDEDNAQFAIYEFTCERISMAKRVKNYPPKKLPAGAKP